MSDNYLLPNWSASHNIHAYTTTRYAGNLATYVTNGVNDALRNRKVMRNELHLPSEPCWLKQEHTVRVIEADSNLVDPIADASFTQEKNIICAVLTADCLPILLCDAAGTIVAAIHAGWRGLADGIIEETLKAMRCDAEKILAWIGPAIGPGAFVVGEEVRQKFITHDVKAKAAFSEFAEQNKWYADLYLLARQRLNSFGVTKVFGGEFCTYTQPDLFFSYRREKEAVGRMASLIWLD
jgi:polyphenol oxidase